MRYLFRGLVRETGKPVEGHVEAVNPDAACNVLAENGIVTEALREDPQPLNMHPGVLPIPQIADALESALDSSSQQVSFDDLAERYRGKNVWVIDRNKIRNRVAQVVDQALEAAESDLEGGATARQRVASAIRGLFEDNKNIATEHNEASIAGMRAIGNGNSAAANNVAGNIAAMNSAALDQQIARLSGVVRQVEGLVAAMASAFRSMSSGAAPRRTVTATSSSGPTQNEVLLEIFKSNLDLRQSMDAEVQTPVQAA